MNVFVSEYLCSGACQVGSDDASLLTEGAAMLNCVIADLLAISDCHVTTCVGEQLQSMFPQFTSSGQESRLQISVIQDPETERHYFERACQQADVVWIIAPELDDILYSRTRWALQAGAQVVGPDLSTIQLTADKWRLFQFLNEHSIPTIPTSELADWKPTIPNSLPCVIKHRFGVGGLGMHLIEDMTEHCETLSKIQENRSDFIVQPFISGRMLSTVVHINSRNKELFPLGEQHLCWKPEFQYQGGTIPVRLSQDISLSIQDLIQRVCDLLPGLAGYIGFDIVLPDMNPTQPMVVEINPRLTTSYTGYRQLTQNNLAERIINPDSIFPSIQWELPREIRFQPDGSIT